MTLQARRVQVDVVLISSCRTVPGGGASAASALSRKPGELSQEAVTRSATTAAMATVAAVRSRRLRPKCPRQRRRSAGAGACPCWRSAAARSSCFRSLAGSLTRSSPLQLGMKRRQPTTHALADDALRAAKVSCDLGVAALLDVVGLDRLPLSAVRSRVARSLERSRSSPGSRSLRHRAGSAPSRAHAAPHPEYDCCAAPRSTCDARSRTTRPAAVVPLKARHDASAAAKVSAARSNASSGPGVRRRKKASTEAKAARRRGRTAQRTCAASKSSETDVAPRSPSFLYHGFTRCDNRSAAHSLVEHALNRLQVAKSPLGLLKALSATSPKPRYSAAS